MYTYSNNLYYKSYTYSKILKLIFNFDAIQFIKFNNTFFNFSFIFSDFNNFFFKTFMNYSNYFFDCFLSLLYLNLKNKALKNCFNFSSLSVRTLDCSLRYIFNEFLYKYRFLTTHLFLISDLNIFYSRCYFSNKSNFYLISLFPSQLNIKTTTFFETSSMYFHQSQHFKFVFFFPLQLYFVKMRTFGFFHNFFNRPVAFSRYIFKEDTFLLFFYSSIVLSFFFWFLKVSNLNELYFFLNFLKKSCLLTLSRKYNKSLSWAISIYTSDLIYVKSLSNFNNLFDFDTLFYKDYDSIRFSGVFLFPLGELFFLYT